MPRATNPTAMPMTAATTAATASASSIFGSSHPAGGAAGGVGEIRFGLRRTGDRLGSGLGRPLMRLHPVSAGATARPEAALGSASGCVRSLLRSSGTGRRFDGQSSAVSATTDRDAASGRGGVESVPCEQGVGALATGSRIGNARQGARMAFEQAIRGRAIHVHCHFGLARRDVVAAGPAVVQHRRDDRVVDALELELSAQRVLAPRAGSIARLHPRARERVVVEVAELDRVVRSPRRRDQRDTRPS